MEIPQIPAGGRRFKQLTEADMTPRQRERRIRASSPGPARAPWARSMPSCAARTPPTACRRSASTSASRA
jgi:hypothetical protein